MKTTDYFKISLRNLSRRKLRSSLTILGIFIAVATVFLLISLSLGLDEAVKEQFRLLGTDKFFIMPKGSLGAPGTGGAVQLTTADAEFVEKISGIKQISYLSGGNAQIEFNSEKRYYQVYGFPLDRSELFTETNAFKPDEGRLLRQGDKGKVMLGSYFKYNKIFKRPVTAGDTLLINGREFKVVGIIAPVGNPGDDQNILMSIEDINEMFNKTVEIDMVYVQALPGVDINDLAERVKQKLMKFRNVDEKTSDFSISTPEELLASFGVILNIITAFLVGVASISLLVGSVGIANTMYTSVIERTKEIGTMKAIGAKNSDILSIFIIESGLLGLIGGIIGVLLGYILGLGVEFIAVNYLGTTLLRISTPIYLIVGCLLFSFIIGALSGFFPAKQASKLNAADALRYE